MFYYLNKIIFPYCTKKRRELKLPPDFPGLVIFDNFNGQCTEDILKLIDDNHINVIIIPEPVSKMVRRRGLLSGRGGTCSTY